MNYTKIIDDLTFEKYKGHHFNENWYSIIIDTNADGYFYENNQNIQNKKVLFKFRKKIINEKLQSVAIDSFLQESKKKHPNRGIAGGISKGEKTARSVTTTGQSEAKYIASNISGYYDRPLREHLKYFNNKIVCRTTSFTLNNIEKWNNALPFIEKCSREYSKLGGKYYSLQKKEYSLIIPQMKIPNTVFTTVTSNYNWRTACHKDSGDYPLGLGNLIVVGKNFTGGYLGFPQFKILIKIEPGDFLLMDVHQWHCNTPIILKDKDNSFRLSFVMYLRKDTINCKKHKKINNSNYFY